MKNSDNTSGNTSDNQDWPYWLGLKSIKGVGSHLFLKLLDQFGTPRAVFRASPSILGNVPGLSERVATAISKFRIPEAIHRELKRVRKHGYTIVTFNDPAYPALLREIHDPPPFLYVYGTLPASCLTISIVGSRHATPYGMDVTHQLGMALASHGVTVVSGMARGIDSAAHAGTLMEHGKTVAVLGCGLGTIYPAENRDLFHRIGNQGAVISEFSFLTTPEPHHFPRRNRIISGMSQGTVVVEATHRSGSLITAKLAAEQGRDVFAVPGRITSLKSVGPHSLIKDGAKLVENVNDILDEFSWKPLHQSKEPGKPPPPDISQEEETVLAALPCDPMHIDRLRRKLSMTPGELSSLLLHLEIKGLVTQIPGNLFSRATPE